MKDENKRDLYLKVRVSQAEMDAIKRKFANQIAHRVNVTNKVYKEDIEDIKSLADKLIQPLLFLQSKCLQLRH